MSPAAGVPANGSQDRPPFRVRSRTASLKLVPVVRCSMTQACEAEMEAMRTVATSSPSHVTSLASHVTPVSRLRNTCTRGESVAPVVATTQPTRPSGKVAWTCRGAPATWGVTSAQDAPASDDTSTCVPTVTHPRPAALRPIAPINTSAAALTANRSAAITASAWRRRPEGMMRTGRTVGAIYISRPRPLRRNRAPRRNSPGDEAPDPWPCSRAKVRKPGVGRAHRGSAVPPSPRAARSAMTKAFCWLTRPAGMERSPRRSRASMEVLSAPVASHRIRLARLRAGYVSVSRCRPWYRPVLATSASTTSSAGSPGTSDAV